MKYTWIFTFSLVLLACTDEKPKEIQRNWNMNESTKLNKDLAVEQEIDIDLYLAQHESWQVDTTGSGLRIVWFKRTDGSLPKANQQAKVHYKIALLDGTQVYETEKDEYDIFRVDNAEMESGIHEGIKLMRVGEKAKLVFPSHLAHGLVGDMDKIPPLSPLVVDVELIGIE